MLVRREWEAWMMEESGGDTVGLRELLHAVMVAQQADTAMNRASGE